MTVRSGFTDLVHGEKVLLVEDVTTTRDTLIVTGPKSREILSGLTDADLSAPIEELAKLEAGPRPQEIAQALREEVQDRLQQAGITVIEARISHLAYAAEIANAMLRRQQASALIAARTQIVAGAVGMVEMALAELEKGQIIELDDERKAAMVSNLLVVLCGEEQAQPVLNTGSLYT